LEEGTGMMIDKSFKGIVKDTAEHSDTQRCTKMCQTPRYMLEYNFRTERHGE